MWDPGRPFLAVSNVGLFGSVDEPAVVPDIMISLDVRTPEDPRPKNRRSYFVWMFGKPPDLVIEIVSNRIGGEAEKAERYARLGVPYYVIFDPDRWLGDRVLRGFVRHGRTYVELLDLSCLDEVGWASRSGRAGSRTWKACGSAPAAGIESSCPFPWNKSSGSELAPTRPSSARGWRRRNWRGCARSYGPKADSAQVPPNACSAGPASVT